MQRGQLSFDFLLSIVLFILVMNFIFAYVNDFEYTNSNVSDNLQNHDTYLEVKDYVLSSQYYSDFNIDLDIKSYSDENCIFTQNSSGLIVGSDDNNFIISEYRGTVANANQHCKSTINIR